MAMKYGLKHKISIAVSVLIILLMTTIRYVTLSYFENQLKVTIAQNQFNLVTGFAGDIDNKLFAAQSQLIAMAREIPPEAMKDQDRIQALLDSMIGLQQIFDYQISILTPEGKILAETPLFPDRRGLDLSFRPYYQNTVANKVPVISDPYISSLATKHPIVRMTAPVFDKNGVLVGILLGAMDLMGVNILQDLAKITIGHGGYLYLTTGESRMMIIHPDDKRILASVPLGVNLLYDKAVKGFEGSGETVNTKGVRMLVSFKHLKVNNWILAVNYPISEAHDIVFQLEKHFFFTTMIGIACVLILVFFLIKFFISPLTAFTRHLETLPRKVGADKLIEIKTHDEIGLLSESFNRMITKLEQQKEALQRSEERYRTVYNSASDAIFIQDNVTGAILDVNQKACEMYGFSRAEALLADVGDLSAGEPPYTLREAMEWMSKAALGEPQLFEWKCKKKTGHLFWVEVKIRLVEIDGLDRLLVTVSDITERKQAEKALYKSEAEFRAIFEGASVGIVRSNPHNGRITQCNQKFCEITGYSFPELSTMSFLDITHPDDRDRDWEIFSSAERGQTPYYLNEKRYIRKDGSIVWVRLSSSFIRNDDGISSHTVGVCEDITARKRMEKEEDNRLKFMSALAAGEPLDTLFELIIDFLEESDPDALASILLLDGKHLIVGSAPKLPNFYNLAIDGLEIGKGVGSCGTAAYTGQRVIVEDIFSHPYWLNFRNLARQADLKSCWSEPVLSANGKVLGTFAIYHRHPYSPDSKDIECIKTAVNFASLAIERQKAEQAQVSRKAAEEANRAKSAFIANMSHEIRTPMNAILGFAHLLAQDSSITPQQTEYVQIINQSGAYLLKLINEILDMSKIEAGRVTLNNVSFCLHDFLDDLAVLFRSRAEGKGLRFNIKHDENLPLNINADEGKLRQVLVNLIGNSVKFTESGEIVVRITAETVGQEVGGNEIVRLTVEVEDTGPGISTEDINGIFEAFSQAQAGMKAGGTGLGLTISQKFVEMMGGNLSVESEVGKGSRFRFQVLSVVATAKPEQVKQAPSCQVIGLESGIDLIRVLVADDNQENRSLMRAILQPVGFEVQEAVNGQDAIDIFKRWSPHVVLMDMRMPVMDGYEATRQIKATESGRSTPVIAVTASVFVENKAEIMKSGVDDYICKPYRMEELFTVLKKCLNLNYKFSNDTIEHSDSTTPPFPEPEVLLTKLPQEVINSMRAAVGEGNMSYMRTLIGQAEKIDKVTAQKLMVLADQYDYDKLLQWLEKGEVPNVERV